MQARTFSLDLGIALQDVGLLAPRHTADYLVLTQQFPLASCCRDRYDHPFARLFRLLYCPVSLSACYRVNFFFANKIPCRRSGDSCGVIDTQFNITLTQFLTWNPEINSQCACPPAKLLEPTEDRFPELFRLEYSRRSAILRGWT